MSHDDHDFFRRCADEIGARQIIELSCGTTGPPDDKGVVVMCCYNEFVETDDIVDVRQHLQFRSRLQIDADVRAAGLTALDMWSDWARTPFTGDPREPLMVFEVTSE